MGMLLAHMQQPPRPILTLRPELQIPWPIASLAMRLLEKDPARRPANAKALIEEVEAAEKGIAPLAPTRVVQANAVVSAEEARTAQEAVAPGPVTGKVAGAGGFVSASPSPAQPQVVSAGKAASAVIPAPEPEKQSRWGIWVGIVVLLVGLGGGGAYIISQHLSPFGKTPASTTPGQGGGASQETPGQPGSHAQSPAATGSSSSGSSSQVQTAPATSAPQFPQRTTPGGQGIQRRPARKASETPTGGANIAPVGPAASAVDPKKIKAAITLGDFYFKDGKYDDAIKAYQEGLNLDPSNPDLRNGMERAKKAKAVEDRILH